MTQEHDDTQQEPKDYTRHIWIGVLIAFVVMILAISLQKAPVPNTSVVTTKHILVRYNLADPSDRARALERIQEARERILNGESFEDMAAEYSEDPGSASKGGYISPQPKGTFSEAYEKYAWSAPLNELSEIVQTSHGFHILVVTDRYVSEGDRYEKELDQRVREERAADAPPSAVQEETTAE
jgi:parvulin-like peptidyl-prolyl isomerase